jgi:hypothetical protein
MALDWIRVSLRGYGGETPSGNLLFEHLGVEPDSGFKTCPSESSWQAASIILLEVMIENVEEPAEPTEVFADRIDQGLRRAAEWLFSRPVEGFDRWRSTGRELDVFIGGWLNDQQFDLDIPAVFLLACGRAGLPIQICTND